MSVDQITALKRRRAAFAASGQTAKVVALDAEIVRLRSGVSAEPVPEPGLDEDVVPVLAAETATADLSDVEAAAAVRRGPGRPRKQR